MLDTRGGQTQTEMAANLKAGIMATTTMVGSALAYSKTQAGETSGQTQGQAQGQRTPGLTGGISSSNTGGGGGQQGTRTQTEVHQTGNNKYQETVNQMMHWKY